jgi:hypothetical protein
MTYDLLAAQDTIFAAGSLRQGLRRARLQAGPMLSHRAGNALVILVVLAPEWALMDH